MKKIIALTFILLIGLMVLGGCTSTTVEPSTNQQQNQKDEGTEPEQNQQQSGLENLPQPPALPEE